MNDTGILTAGFIIKKVFNPYRHAEVGHPGELGMVVYPFQLSKQALLMFLRKQLTINTGVVLAKAEHRH